MNKKQKSLTNKGFSLVELIIVIAIMAILAGALAPALISYVAKSRRSTTVSNAQTIATAIHSAISDEAVLDDLETNFATIDSTPIKFDTSIGTGDSNPFGQTVNSNVSGGIASYAKLKATKFSKKATDAGLKGKAISSSDGYYISIDPASSTIKIYIKADTGVNPANAATSANGTALTDNYVEVYPNANDAMTK